MEQSGGEHGTSSQYQFEMKHLGVACEECAEANRDYTRAWRIRTHRVDHIKVPIVMLHEMTAQRAGLEKVMGRHLGALTAHAIATRKDESEAGEV